MPENRAYAGPADAAELMVSDDRYALVVRRDLTDEQAASLGYTFDGDEAVRTGRSLALRTVTVSDELGLKLDAATFELDGETLASWPKVGGTPAAQTADDESLPATKPVEVELAGGEVETITSAEADRRAYDAAGAERALLDGELVDADAASAAEAREAEAARERLLARLTEVDSMLDSPAADELDADDREALVAERARINDDLNGGN